MRIALPLASGLLLALVATTASAADDDVRRSGRSDLLRTAERPDRVDRIDRIDRTEPVASIDPTTTDGSRSALSSRRFAPGPGSPGLSSPVTHDQAGLLANVHAASIAEALSLRPARSAAQVHHAVRLTDDPAYQSALERRQRSLAYVVLAIDSSGRETLIRR